MIDKNCHFSSFTLANDLKR